MSNDLQILINTFPEQDWNYPWLSANANIDYAFVDAHITEDWNYFMLSGNFTTTFQNVLDNPTRGWDYSVLHGISN